MCWRSLNSYIISEIIDTTTGPEGSTEKEADPLPEETTPEPETTTDPSLVSSTIDDFARRAIRQTTPEPESSTFDGN